MNTFYSEISIFQHSANIHHDDKLMRSELVLEVQLKTNYDHYLRSKCAIWSKFL